MADNMNLTTEHERAQDIPSMIRGMVAGYIKAEDGHDLQTNEVYVVWFCFILGGWKALVSTTIADGRYYEVTFDKNKNQIYLDTYEKIRNIAIDVQVFDRVQN